MGQLVFCERIKYQSVEALGTNVRTAFAPPALTSQKKQCVLEVDNARTMARTEMSPVPVWSVISVKITRW